MSNDIVTRPDLMRLYKPMEDPKYWFPAKRYGWGWGLPCAWQGWMVMLGYVLLMILIPLVFNPVINWIEFTASVFIATFALVVICLLKGEPPKWRCGNTDDEV